MCGIVAQINSLTRDLVKNLRKLQYRGYDSYGITFISDKVYSYKGLGQIPQEIVETKPFRVGMGHVRWATNSEVTIEDAQPIEHDNIILVHNGIVDNTHELSDEIDLDSRILAKSLNDLLNKGKNGLVEFLREKVKGQISIVFYHKLHPESLFAYNKNGSLVFSGMGRIASDIFSLSDADSYYRLLDDDLLILDIYTGKYQIKTTKKDAYKESYPIDPPKKKISKGKYRSYMEKEIYEQEHYLDWKTRLNTENLNWETFDNIHIFGCGSSYHAGMIGARLFRDKYKSTKANAYYASEYKFENFTNGKTFYIAISQSGETKDTIDVVKKIKQDVKSPHLLSITNTPHSLLASLCENNIHIDCGKEIGVAATKTFFSQVLTFIDIIEKITPSRTISISGIDVDIAKIIDQIGHYRHMLVFGRQYNYFLAKELALKLKEVSYVHAESLPAAEVKHGPLALIDDDVLSIFIMTGVDENIMNNIREIKARRGKVLGIAEEENALFDYFVRIPKGSGILETIPALQLLAYRLSLVKGLDADFPRSLAKCVTV
jgi:glucosamine--fructose-6-phosphate aminotransferase (isomerizing)